MLVICILMAKRLSGDRECSKELAWVIRFATVYLESV